MKNTVKKITVNPHDRPSSISLEPAFIAELKEIGARTGKTMDQLATEIEDEGLGPRLSTGFRLFVLRDLQNRLINSQQFIADAAPKHADTTAQQ